MEEVHYLNAQHNNRRVYAVNTEWWQYVCQYFTVWRYSTICRFAGINYFAQYKCRYK